jgi:RNA polymerase sigma-70 factor (ECF subfamily)
VSLPSSVSEELSSTDQSRWFAEEIQPHEPALRAWLRNRFPSLSDIDDLIQETYAKLFRARKAGKISETRPYLFATARNTASGICRHNRIIPFEPLAETDGLNVVEEKPRVDEAVSRDQELAMLAEAISVLPTRCRQVLTLRKLHGLSHREIARQLGISENTVNAHAALGVLRCREYLQARGVVGGTVR